MNKSTKTVVGYFHTSLSVTDWSTREAEREEKEERREKRKKNKRGKL